MTPHPCRCEMCSNTNKRKLILCANTNYYCTKRQDFISYDEEDLIKKVGCLSHPQAREYLMRGVKEMHDSGNETIDKVRSRPTSHTSSQRIEQVIGELERLASEEEQLKKESKTNEPWMGHAYANSAYLKAIAILREGAK